MEALLQKVRYTFELVKFSHTLFALPFALAAFLVASRGNFSWMKLGWVILGMFFARTAAMAFNRLVDSSFDAKNPRTKDRHLPQGLLSRSYVIGLIVLTSGGFFFAASQLNRLTLLLSPFCLLLLFFYSLTKRFTHLTQIFLGLSLGMAPVGAYVAVQGAVPAASLVLGSAVLFWVAGFDLLYALQDLEFDRSQGLHSMTLMLGIPGSLKFSSFFHLLFVVLLLIYGRLENLGLFYWIGIILTAFLLLWQHLLLKGDLKKINAAFFTANGLLSLCFFLFVLLDFIFPA